jgi:hypothetical protein
MLPVKRKSFVKGLDNCTLRDKVFAIPFCAYMMNYLLKELARIESACDSAAHKIICHS